MRYRAGNRLTTRRAALDAELRQFRNHVMAVSGRGNFAIDIEDLSVDADIKRPARRGGFFVSDDAVRLRGQTLRVAEERIIHVELCSELLVLVQRVDAHGKKRDIECPDLLAALTERLALRCSTSAEGSGEPGEHDRLLPAVIRQPVSPAVGPGQFEFRR